jgi:hypothetical protein
LDAKVKGKWIHSEKSSVDFIAAIPPKTARHCGGAHYPYEAARIEVKLCDDNVLPHSRLTEKQSNWLSDWKLLGLQSFVLWVHRTECFLIEYPNYWFKRGKSLSIETAKKISWQ